MRKKCELFIFVLLILLLLPITVLAEGEAIDYSDAPASYGTATHTGLTPDTDAPNGFVEWLGSSISAESSPLAEDTFDDGVSWSPMEKGSIQNLTITTTFETSFDCSESVNIEAWIDFNQNGIFDTTEKALDMFDRIYSDTAVLWCGLNPLLLPTTFNKSINIPADAVVGNSWMRVRLWWADSGNGTGADANANPTGNIQWGEVEDYPVTIIETSTTPNAPPVADGGGPYNGNEGATINFDGSNSHDDDEGDSIVKYEWDLNDDGIFEITNNPNPSHIYNDNGSYNASLKVTDIQGESTVDTFAVNIANVAPQIQSINIDKNPALVGDQIQVSVQINDPGNDTFLFDYDFDWSVHGSNGKEITNSDQSIVNWTYQQMLSDINVAVWVRDEDGGADFSFVSMSLVENIPPVANAGGPYLIDSENNLLLNASASNEPNSPLDSIVKYEWDLNNDGTFEINSTTPTTTISWSQLQSLGFGDHPINLKVTDSIGATGNNSTTLTINQTIKTASQIKIKINPSKVKPGQEITISGQIKTLSNVAINNASIIIQQNISNTTWQDLIIVQSNSNGNFSTKTNPTKTTQYRALLNQNQIYSYSESNIVKVNIINTSTLLKISSLNKNINRLKKEIKKLKIKKSKLHKGAKNKNSAEKIKTIKQLKKINKRISKINKAISVYLKAIKTLKDTKLILPD